MSKFRIIIFKMVNTINYLFSGGGRNRNQDINNDNDNSIGGDDHFDNYEEVD